MSNDSSFCESESGSANHNAYKKKYIQSITSSTVNDPVHTCSTKSIKCKTIVPKLPVHTNEEKPHKKKAKLVLNVSDTQYEVVRYVGRHIFHYKLSRDPEAKDWDIKWTDNSVEPSTLACMKPYQKINHFPGMYELARKNYLGKNLMKMSKAFANEYDFFPQTWMLPSESSEFRAQFKAGQYYILKPEASCQGKGIFMINNLDQIEKGEKYVAQQYLTEPYLIEGLKFDLRIYILVYGCDPLRIFIYEDGLARFATEKYHNPTSKNCKNMYMHLTNYAINKNSSKFEFNEDSEYAYTGHKRCLQAIWDYIDKHNGDSNALRARIEDIIIKTICTAQPTLSHIYKSCQANDFDNSCCFEILGFDVILDKNLKPYILEVNHSPSFTTDTPFDRKVKVDLIRDTLIILHTTSKKKKIYLECKKNDVLKRQSEKRISLDIRNQQKAERIEKRIKFENKHLGKYRVIFPNENTEKYMKFIEVAKSNWEEFTGVKKQKSSSVAKLTWKIVGASDINSKSNIAIKKPSTAITKYRGSSASKPHYETPALPPTQPKIKTKYMEIERIYNNKKKNERLFTRTTIPLKDSSIIIEKDLKNSKCNASFDNNKNKPKPKEPEHPRVPLARIPMQKISNKQIGLQINSSNGLIRFEGLAYFL